MAESSRETARELDLQYNAEGLVPAIVQDVDTGQIVMMAWMNAEALAMTLDKGLATFYSRSRGKLWTKGESSGHVQEVKEIRVDCDQDVLLLRCRSHGPGCHAGYDSCFYRALESNGRTLRLVAERRFDPDAVYDGKKS